MAWRCGSYTTRFMHPTHWLISTQVDYQLIDRHETLEEIVAVGWMSAPRAMRAADARLN